MSLRYLSVCSGIEAATVAWHPLGWVPVAFADIEKFPSAVLAHHYPAVAFNAWQDPDYWPDRTGPLDCDPQTQAVMTLAIRGRGNGSNLEARTDGTANAILTPSGGRAGIGVGAVAIDCFNGKIDGETSATIGTRGSHSNSAGPQLIQQMQVRRLTPRECERLQGFPDDYTRIPWRGKPAEDCPDGPRYRALGNSMAVPVMRWIGERIAHCESVLAQSKEPAA